MENEKSAVLQYVLKEMESVEARGTPEIEDINTLMLSFAAGTFGQPLVHNADMEGFIGQDRDFLVNNDSVIFEVSCYLFFRITRWLAAHEPELEKEIMPILGNAMLKVFSSALKIEGDDCAILGRERTRRYWEIVRDVEELDKQIEKIHDFLVELISAINESSPLPAKDIKHVKFSLNAVQHFLIRMRISQHDVEVYPELFSVLQQYCDAFKRNGR